MSLFRSREWWSVNLNENEMFDSNCLLITNVAKDRYQSILLGNHSGLLRIFSPTSEMTDDGLVTGYTPSDLLLESQLQYPILQLGMGALVSGSDDKFLAVLHPRLLSVFTLARREDVLMMEVAYQHQLRHSAHSFVIGPFGGVRGRDFLAIQSLDGLLSFYEQESLVFRLYLPEFLLPGPFKYVEQHDCFLFLNASLSLDCYAYGALATTGSSEEASTKKLSKLWTHNIGESILDILPVVNNGLNILVLSERNLYNLSENGKILFMKRLEYKPTAFYAYVTAEAKKLMVLISTDSYFLNIYENTCLKWATKTDQIPVCVGRIFLSTLPGGIVMISEDGLLQVVYLGTHPSIYLVPPAIQPEINLLETEMELKQLQSEILENDALDPPTEDAVNINLTVDQNLETDNDVKMCRVIVDIITQSPISKVQVLFVVDLPLTATKACNMISSCCNKTTLATFVCLKRPGIVSNLGIKIVVSYVTSNGVPNVLERNGTLPLHLVVAPVSPTKEAKYKLTIITNKPVCAMNQIFGDLVTEEVSSNVIGFKYLNSDVVVTLLAAKSSQRYRLQSDQMEAITLILDALTEKLKKYFHRVPDFNLSYSNALPLQVYFDHIERYFLMLRKRKSHQEQLGKRTCQYRTIQKKVLVNLKDVTPKPVSNLHKILKDTHDMIVSSIHELEGIEKELETCRCSISALTRLHVSLLELMIVGHKDLEHLRVVFSPNMHDTDDQGWLEVQAAAASFFLRTSLAKSVRDQQKATDIVLEPITDISKVLKHFSGVIDRVTKGTHLLERNEFEGEKEWLTTIPTNNLLESNETSEVEVIPPGSKLVDVQAPVSPFPLATKREKCFKKQERVDSLTGINTNPVVPSIMEEISPPEEATSIETTATIETRAPDSVEVDDKETDDVMIPNGNVIHGIEDDAIWDVKMEEMRI